MIGTSSNEPAFAAKCTTYSDTFSSTERCSTQGKNPTESYTSCLEGYGCYGDSFPTTHKRDAQDAVNDQQYCKQVVQKQDFGVDCSTSNGK